MAILASGICHSPKYTYTSYRYYVEGDLNNNGNIVIEDIYVIPEEGNGTSAIDWDSNNTIVKIEFNEKTTETSDATGSTLYSFVSYNGKAEPFSYDYETGQPIYRRYIQSKDAEDKIKIVHYKPNRELKIDVEVSDNSLVYSCNPKIYMYIPNSGANYEPIAFTENKDMSLSRKINLPLDNSVSCILTRNANNSTSKLDYAINTTWDDEDNKYYKILYQLVYTSSNEPVGNFGSNYYNFSNELNFEGTFENLMPNTSYTLKAWLVLKSETNENCRKYSPASSTYFTLGFFRWNGSAWEAGELYRWNGSAWEKQTQVMRWNGSAWEK